MEEAKAEVDSETKMFTAKIQLLPGENEIFLRATKNKLEENTITETLTVNDDMAMLVLTEYLYGDVDRSSLRVAGVTAPGAKKAAKKTTKKAAPKADAETAEEAVAEKKPAAKKTTKKAAPKAEGEAAEKKPAAKKTTKKAAEPAKDAE